MKDFRLRNDTVLLLRNEPVNDIMGFAEGKKVLYVYGGESVHRNGCYEDVKKPYQPEAESFLNWAAQVLWNVQS